MFEGLFENLRFQCLLAQEPMKFANLVLQSPIIRSRHDRFPTAGRGQAALRHQPTPGEQLVWGNAIPTSHQAYRHTRLEGLFDHANLLRRRPAPTTLNRHDDLPCVFPTGIGVGANLASRPVLFPPRVAAKESPTGRGAESS